MIVISILTILISACGRKEFKSEPVVNDTPPSQVISVPDSLSYIIEEKSPEVEQASPEPVRSTSSSSNNSRNYDNMRGFDPASEDDMDDNGMSRYMENNDEEGWD